MLIQDGGLHSGNDLRADDRSNDAPATVCVIGSRFVEDDDEDSVLLKGAVRQQWGDMGLQPAIGLLQSAIVGIINQVRNDEGNIGQRIIVEISCELRERHKVHLLDTAVVHIRPVGEGVVVADIKSGIPAK